MHGHAIVLARDHGLSIYAAPIVSAAQDAARQVLCSEDLQHGQRFEGLTIENPFRP